ncbi:MAG: hypothetical protein LH473_00715 [Chitinophagales bacterium]|nr:hypothetical protein [Chitinophagales bacterium]
MKKEFLFPFLIIVMCAFSFTLKNNKPKVVNASAVSVPLKIMTDVEYPDNNAIGFRASIAGQYSHTSISFVQNSKGNFDITIPGGNANSDTIYLKDINLLEMMPTVPDFVKGNKDLTKICLLNQEWNRMQVKIPKEYYTLSGSGNEKTIVSRVDLANNCLAKGLWECILFTKEADKEVLYFQSWFNFPDDLYNTLFEKRNGFSIAPYDDMLKNYDHSYVGLPIDLKKLRTISPGKEVKFVSKNDQLYPLAGERQTKAKNIIAPVTVASINDFLNDQTRYATFAPPGMYSRTQPRVTQLSRLQKLEKVTISRTTSKNTALTVGMEFHLSFSSNDGSTKTELVIGGVQKDRIPVLNEGTIAKGFQMPMGISNHTFYSSYSELLKFSSKQDPYFAFLLDNNGKWIDSHDVGIDGPLFWIDDQDPTKLHLMILSFERHSFVGHYIIDLPKAS